MGEKDEMELCVLPKNWKEGEEGVYSFSYRSIINKSTYVFKIIFSEESVYVNAACLQDPSKLYSVPIKMNDLSFDSLDKNK